jgi:Protein of unknown function (DUF3631)
MKGPVRERLAKLFAMLGSDNANERENARAIIDEILRKNRKTWNDLTELLQTGSDGAGWNIQDDAAAPPSTSTGANIHALDLVHHLLEEHLELRPLEYAAIALWILHTHVYNQFLVTPRLALVSPVRGCGKTTALLLLALLTSRGRKDDGITAAAIFRLIDQQHCTLLLDEADNLGLEHNGILRSVLNSGHRKGGCLTRVIKDAPRRFSTFAPMAIAAIGVLPLPIMHRSVVIHMERATRQLRYFDESDRAVNHAYGMIRAWARDVKLEHNPELPGELRNRPADNWRVLIAIADSFGRAWGATARKAAAEFSRTYRDEDAAVTLLSDIRTIYHDLAVDRHASAKLVEELVGMEDAGWADWRGLRDDQQPRRLSQGELARLLAPFGIRPRTIWPRRRNQKSKSSKGYFRSQFESAWHKYCNSDGTPSHSKKSARLQRR